MLWLWRYIMGYLTIKIQGENGEQLLNRAASNGIKIWNLIYKNGSIVGNISIKNYLKLRTVKRGIKCNVKIINKCGYVFWLKKYKNRIGFVVGFATFGAILFFLSNFIWIINVEGNTNLTTQEILSSCKKIGIYEGVSKKKINSKYDAQKLQLAQNGIAWCSLNIEGSILTVNLSETAISDKEQRQTPSNLKATIEGKIKKIDIASGNAVVKVGDTVSKGDLLVSGIIENLSSTHFVHSEGIVIAETKRTFSAEGQYNQSVEQKTNKSFKRYTLEIFKLKIPLFLGNVKQKHFYKKEVNTLTLFNKKIPIKIACEQYDLFEKRDTTYTKENLEQLLYDDIKNQIEKFEFISVEEDDRELITTDKGILLKITYNCVENIAAQDKILFDTTN